MEQPVPFINAEESGLSEFAGASPAAHNVVVDKRGAVRRRPGIAQYTTAAFDAAGAPIDLVYRVHGGDIYVVQTPSGLINRQVYRLSGKDAARVSLGTMNAPVRPLAAETEGLLALTTGRAPFRVDLGAKTLAPLGGSPPRSTHVAANAARLLLNDIDDPSRVRYSDVQLGPALGGHESWPALNIFAAEARPDRVVAIAENTNEVFVWGETTLQVYGPDPQFVFAPLATREYGTPAPYSIVKKDQSFGFLDHKRRFILTDGRGFEVVSDAIQGTLDDLTSVTDAFGYWLHMGNADVLIWSFPTDGVTFVYQAGIWGRWTGYDAANQSWQLWPVTAFHQRTDDKVALVGTSSGRVGSLSFAASDDLGAPIKAFVQTGFLDRGSDRHKLCRRVRIAMRRGHSTATTAPLGWLGWRDRPGPLEGRIPVDFGAAGETDIVVSLDSLGVYRRRQWVFEFGEAETLELAKVTEEFDVLDY